jgi:Domain of unknown function (DUF4388)
MALSGQLSDLSLAELIEFFCNQRKTGRLKVAYQRAPGYFYFDRGDLVDAKIGSLNGVEAIYYALTLANASFKFSPVFEPTKRTIHQPWTQVTLEGLRRLDEGIKPKEPTFEGTAALTDDPDGVNEGSEQIEFDSNSPMPLSLTVDNAASGGRSSKMVFAGVVAAIIALVAVIGIPAGWYGKGKAEAAAQPAAAPAPETQATNTENNPAPEQPEQSAVEPTSTDAAATASDPNALAAKRAREAKERARLAEASAAKQAANSPETSADAAKKVEATKPGPKMVSVQVTYDESGRVTQTSGGDGTAQRIARQKHFPSGKAGTTTITIPIN